MTLRKEIKIKCLQGQMKEGEKDIDCSGYPRGMKHEVLSHYQSGYMRGLCIGVDKSCELIIERLEKIKKEFDPFDDYTCEELDNLIKELEKQP